MECFLWFRVYLVAWSVFFGLERILWGGVYLRRGVFPVCASASCDVLCILWCDVYHVVWFASCGVECIMWYVVYPVV